MLICIVPPRVAPAAKIGTQEHVDTWWPECANQEPNLAAGHGATLICITSI